MLKSYNLLLADDDLDDCNFFKEALEELNLTTSIRIVNDGVELMQLLLQNGFLLPDVIFLDINMPQKNGFECLLEIKRNDKLKQIPVIIISTSFDKKAVDQFYEKGAHYYIRKPTEFSQLKLAIQKSLLYISESNTAHPELINFVI